MTQTKDQDRVVIFDTTLRDGEQSPGATMSHEEKLEIAGLLDEMGVDIIEAGFPIASEGDFRAVSEIAKNARNSVICGLSRAQIPDIDRNWEAIQHAKRPRIHTFIGTSPLHRAIPNLDMDQMAERIHETVTHARNLCDDVQWSPMDATRTERDYLCRVVEIAIKAGATTINIPDTVGYTAPRESAEIIRMLLERVPGADEVVFSTHCHNDLGMATANSLAAVEAGARQIECTINGLGERAGNTALEEVVMALRVRNDIMPYRTGIDTTKIMNLSRRVATVSGFAVQFNKAIVGKNAFLHESGIHQDGVLRTTSSSASTRAARRSAPSSRASGSRWGRTSSRTSSSASRISPTARRKSMTRTSSPSSRCPTMRAPTGWRSSGSAWSAGPRARRPR
jgi:2-isopropylmalate synthase